MVDLFEIVDDESKYEPNFWVVANSVVLGGVRQLINEVFNSWDGFDNHFAQEFQTSNFNSRLWELVLYATFKSMGYQVDRCPEGRPDFKLTKNGQTVFVEAVTSNPHNNDEQQLFINTFDQEPFESTMLKIRSALTSKITRHKYWDMDWVKGHPFIVAICPFHSREALNVVDFDMIMYLYGVTIKKFHDAAGQLIIEETKFDSIVLSEKSFVPFFELPRAANISAVLFSNTGTVGKFSRIAFQKGYDSKKVAVFYYSGSCADDTPNSLGIAQFAVELKANEPRDFTDEWRFGTTVFLNPNAIVPLDEDYFDSVTRGKYSNEEGFLRKMLSFHPYNGKNMRVNTVTKKEETLSQKLRAWYKKRNNK